MSAPPPPLTPSSYQEQEGSFRHLLISLHTSWPSPERTGHQAGLPGPPLPGQSRCACHTHLGFPTTTPMLSCPVSPHVGPGLSFNTNMKTQSTIFCAAFPLYHFEIIVHSFYFRLARTRNHMHCIFSCLYHLLLNKGLNLVLSCFSSLVLNYFSSISLLFHTISITAYVFARQDLFSFLLLFPLFTAPLPNLTPVSSTNL